MREPSVTRRMGLFEALLIAVIVVTHAVSLLRRWQHRSLLRPENVADFRQEACLALRQLGSHLPRITVAVAPGEGTLERARVERELARLLILRRALPWQSYRIFGPVDALWAALEQDTAARATLRSDYAPREDRPDGRWRHRYGRFLADYALAFGEAPDPRIWRPLPPGAPSEGDRGFYPHWVFEIRETSDDGDGDGDGGGGAPAGLRRHASKAAAAAVWPFMRQRWDGKAEAEMTRASRVTPVTAVEMAAAEMAVVGTSVSWRRSWRTCSKFSGGP